MNRFADKSDISQWALNPVALCIKNEIVFGSNNTINPEENISRAETTAIIRRMLKKAGVI